MVKKYFIVNTDNTGNNDPFYNRDFIQQLN
jgi:hypothetical protein